MINGSLLLKRLSQLLDIMIRIFKSRVFYDRESLVLVAVEDHSSLYLACFMMKTKIVKYLDELGAIVNSKLGLS